MSFLKISEIANVLRVSTQTVRRLIATGELPSVCVGRQRRVPADAFDAYMLRSRSERSE